MLKIISAPNPVLSQPAKKITKIDNKILKIIEEMEKSLLFARDPIGVGLAAPQVGISLQIFIAKPTEKSKTQVFINPKIANEGVAPEEGLPTTRTEPAEGALAGGRLATGPRQDKTTKGSTKLEGCLSLPDIWGEVRRQPSITISYSNEKGKKYSKEFTGFISTIIQHEMDHLNGVLFPKRVFEQKSKLYKSEKDEKGKDVFEEIEI